MLFKTKFLHAREISKIRRFLKLIPSSKRNIQNTTLFKTIPSWKRNIQNTMLLKLIPLWKRIFKIQRLKLIPSWKRNIHNTTLFKTNFFVEDNIFIILRFLKLSFVEEIYIQYYAF